MKYKFSVPNPIAVFSSCFGNAAIVINHSGKVLVIFEYDSAKHFKSIFKAARYLLKSGYYMETRRKKPENKIINPIACIIRYIENGKYQYQIFYKSGKDKIANYPLSKQAQDFMMYCSTHKSVENNDIWM